MNAKVNNAVKFREWWRPFAPSLKKEAAAEYLESITDSPFMILTAQVRPEKRGVIPSVTHVDGSARPQTVERDINPLYWRLIDGFEKRTGVPVIMNTSFNLRGEAIVHTPTDAVRTFFSSGMDALEKVRTASVGVCTIASPRRLNEVFMITGTPVRFSNPSIRRQ